jgi:N-acetylglucosamine kinase-like BadF-type ATPase
MDAARPVCRRVLQALDVPISHAGRTDRAEPRPQIINLAPLVFSAAVAGDAIARRLIRDQGREIGLSIVAILRRLGLLETPCQAVLGGSIFYGEGTLLMGTIKNKVRPSAPLAQIKRLDMRPVVGAILLAADRAGITPDEAFYSAACHLAGTLKLEGYRGELESPLYTVRKLLTASR